MPLPNLSASGSSGATGRNDGQSSSVFDMPFSFDHSGWNVSIGGSGAQTASGAQGQGGGAGAGVLGSPLLLIALAAYFLLRR